MRRPKMGMQQPYRLVLSDDGKGLARTIEFEASCPDNALYLAQQQCRGREAELFEGERSLGRLKCEPQGYWLLSPTSRPAARS